MKHPCSLKVLVCFAAVACASACASEWPLPAAVAAALKENADLCREVEGKPHVQKAVTWVDLNADGNQDYVLDVAGIECEGAPSIFGDRDKAVIVFVGDNKGGAVQAFTDSVYGATVERQESSAVLWLTVVGAACGKAPAPDFASEHFCDRALVWNAANGSFSYAPVTAAQMIE